jgi:hypothetical protein
MTEEIERLKRCITMAMGCISPLGKTKDERLAWYRLLDAMEGREPRGVEDIPALSPKESEWLD